MTDPKEYEEIENGFQDGEDFSDWANEQAELELMESE